ncbi:XRE family transcriptional regulator [Iodidimonas gelatinilytica]|uniref:XRE family transcriptional regulator n=1 Tax=Iodidimonas gelatinilytica TaxID=1236966 RepID=A0A5A7N569_9PROT|nr:ImmA/IrrE family metallo-endopeptidase [Iodidimonas gelatinilytica]GER02199.1 XRE family transcriptional regulator [Iodidimonas gelatinilytica]
MSGNELMEKPDWVSPPGHTMISLLEQNELTVEDFAERIGRTKGVTQKLLDGKHAIDVQLARQLTDVFGASESFWMAREHDYRASMELPEKVSVTSFEDLISILPLADMKKFGWIENARSRGDKIAQSMEFFGVSTIAQWQGRYENAFRGAAYRRATAYASCEIATTAWLRQGEIETQADEVAKWSPEQLRRELDAFRRLTWYKSPSLFLPKLKEGLARAGVKFAIVRAPKGCSASGAIRILADDTPHIQLSFRYLSDDQFWFSLFHEMGHLLLHFDKMPILENTDLEEEECESEANEFASQVIVPMVYQEELLDLLASKPKIIEFAKKVGVSPGLIVGQLQHAGIIRYNQMQHLKRRYRWVD